MTLNIAEKQFSYRIRELRTEEFGILDSLLYEAIFQLPNHEPLPREIIHTPEIYVYIKDFGKPSDYCLIAEIDNQIIGAVWSRILAGDIRGFGNIDDQTPEFAIAVFPEYRNHGIGTALMKAMLHYLALSGYRQTSLSVKKNNYAVKMYQNLGFEIISENKDDYLMLKLLNLNETTK